MFLSWFGLLYLIGISCRQKKEITTNTNHDEELHHIFKNYAFCLFVIWVAYAIGVGFFVHYVVVSGNLFNVSFVRFRIIYGYATFSSYTLFVLVAILRRKCYKSSTSAPVNLHVSTNNNNNGNNNGGAIAMTSINHQPNLLTANSLNNSNKKHPYSPRSDLMNRNIGSGTSTKPESRKPKQVLTPFTAEELLTRDSGSITMRIIELPHIIDSLEGNLYLVGT